MSSEHFAGPEPLPHQHGELCYRTGYEVGWVFGNTHSNPWERWTFEWHTWNSGYMMGLRYRFIKQEQDAQKPDTIPSGNSGGT